MTGDFFDTSAVDRDDDDYWNERTRIVGAAVAAAASDGTFEWLARRLAPVVTVGMLAAAAVLAVALQGTTPAGDRRKVLLEPREELGRAVTSSQSPPTIESLLAQDLSGTKQ
jgi:hypothetical protein